MKYNIVVSEAELEVVALALGRMLSPRKVAERKPASAKAPRYKGKVAKLSDGAFGKLTERWAKACNDPEKWHVELQDIAAVSTNRPANTVKTAWGIK